MGSWVERTHSKPVAGRLGEEVAMDWVVPYLHVDKPGGTNGK